MTRKSAFVISVIVVVVAAAGTGALIWRSHQPSPSPPIASNGAAASIDSSTHSPTTPRGDITVDPRRQQLIGVRTVKASRENVSHAIRAVGIVRTDETRVVDVNAKVEGWVRDLAADYTGRLVRQGDLLLTLYSPDLLATEQEYLLALRTRDELQSSTMPEARAQADTLVLSARQRLSLWDLTPEDLRDLDERRQAKDAIAFRAPMTGVVVDKPVVKGAHVTPGQTLFKIADLSVVWIEADVYEQDAAAVKIGAPAAVTLEAYPGEHINGRVVYLSPFVDPQTRTTKARCEFPNPQGRLKPGMYASVEIQAPGIAGITLPTDAVLDTGREQIVFVAQGDGYFTPRAITIGRRVADRIEILKGVAEGESVAAGATFFLDSESQLRGGLQAYAPSTNTLVIALHTTPNPPKSGANDFEVTVTEVKGAAVDDAEVSLQLFMPAMPAMGMPAMKSDVKLSPTGNGRYRGAGQIPSSGQWDTTITVARGGQILGRSKTTLIAQ